MKTKDILVISGYTLFVFVSMIGSAFFINYFIERLRGRPSMVWLTGGILTVLFLALILKLFGDGLDLIIKQEKWSRMKDRYIGYVVHPNMYIAYIFLVLGVFLIFAGIGTWWIVVMGSLFSLFGFIVILRRSEIL